MPYALYYREVRSDRMGVSTMRPMLRAEHQPMLHLRPAHVHEFGHSARLLTPVGLRHGGDALLLVRAARGESAANGGAAVTRALTAAALLCA